MLKKKENELKKKENKRKIKEEAETARKNLKMTKLTSAQQIE